MVTRSYIIDFQEPGQVADAYNHYFSQFAFLLNTADELKLASQVRIRFNLPDGHGTTIVARVVSSLPGQGYGLQLPDNHVTKWLFERAGEYADRAKRVRKPESAKSFYQPQTIDELKTRPIDRPPSRAPSMPVVSATHDPSTRPIGKHQKGPGPMESTGEIPDDIEPDESEVPADSPITRPIGSRDDDDLAEQMAPTELELLRRVQKMDEVITKQQENLPPGATVQAAPPASSEDPVDSGIVAPPAERAKEPPRALSDDERKLSLYARISGLSTNQKKKLAISGGEEERSALMADQDRSLHLWVLKNPSLTEPEVITFSSLETLSPEALNFLLQNRRWGTNTSIAKNLALNPQTPPEAIPNLLTVLSTDALKELVNAPDIRHLISRQARRILMERSQI
jgi:hypothetical protein